MGKKPRKEKELYQFEQQEPRQTVMLAENVNSEGTFKLLKNGRPSIGTFSDEAGGLFGGNAFLKDNMQKTITFYSSAWDGKSLDKLRSGEGFTKLYDRRIAMHLMIQPIIAEKVLNDELMQAQGFLPRFLLAYPKTKREQRFYKDENITQHRIMLKFYATCNNILSQPLKVDVETGGLIFDNLCIDEQAHVLWVEYYNYVEKLLTPQGDLELIFAYGSKNAEQALRIAGVLTLAKDYGARTITLQTMENAITLAHWYLLEALRLRQEAITPPEIRKAENLLKWIKRKGHKQISLRLVTRNTGLNAKEKAAPIIKLLEEHSYLKKGIGKTIIDGMETNTFWEVQA